MTIIFEFGYGDYPTSVYEETDPSTAYRITFNNANITKIIYNTKGVVYALHITDRARGKLYSNNEEPIPYKEELRFKHVKTLQPEDISWLQLKYNIDISLLEFDKSSQLTDACIKRIKDRVIRLALEAIETNNKHNTSNLYKWLWNMNRNEHINIVKDSIDRTSV